MAKSLNFTLFGATVAAALGGCGGTETETVKIIKNFVAETTTTGSTTTGLSTVDTGSPTSTTTSTSGSGAGGASTTGETTSTTVGMGGSGGASTGAGGKGGSTGTAGAPNVDAGSDAPTNNGPINVLVFNHTAGYGHQSRQTAIPLFQAEAAANNINFDLKYAHVTPIQPEGTNDASTPADLSAFTPGGLDKYDVIFFLNTTGHVFQDANEAVHQQALQAYMEQHHGGFMGTHSATDTYDEGWQWYQDFIGSIYSGHSGVVSGSSRWKDGVTHPILTLGAVPNPWPRTEEWYAFRRDVTGIPDFTVLLLANAPGPNGAVSERPIAWVHNLPGGGRVFNCAFGHLVDAFKEPAVMKMLITAIKWTGHRIP